MGEVDQQTASKAAEIQSRLNSEATGIRTNGELTEQARLTRLAKAYMAAQDEMARLQQSWAGESAGEAEKLTRGLFGAANTAGSDAISTRDADDRAAQLEDADEAVSLMQRALRNGDAVLARAVALRAFEMRQMDFGSNWNLVLDTYAEVNPDVAAGMEKLARLKREGVHTSWHNALIFAVPKPAELERLSGIGLRAAAAGEAVGARGL